MLNCFPTTDVHLLTAAGRDQPLDLFLFAKWPPDTVGAPWTDLSTVPDIQLELKLVPPATAIVANHVTGSPSPSASPAFTVHPAGVGTVIAQTLVSHPALTGLQIAALVQTIRITVHADIQRFWISVETITMFAGESNYLVPITAIFDDNSQGDVTSHRCWKYETSDPAIATVDDLGRIHAVSDGVVSIIVTLKGSTLSQMVTATILPSLASGHPHAQVLPWGSVSGDRARIYVISEGYDDPFRFEDDFNTVVRAWFESSQNQPFKMLRDRFAVFGILDLVNKRGITIGPVLDAQATAEPTTIAPADITSALRIADQRDTRFGLMYGARLGDPVMREGSPATLGRWLAPAREHRTISVDWRRLPDVHTDPGVAFMDYLRRYLDAVATSATGQPSGFGQLTADDRVVILCDDQLRGGLLLAVFTMVLPERLVVSAAMGSNPGFDHVAAVAGEPRRFDRTVAYTQVPNAAASTVVHEIGHSYRLGDEYEEKRGPVAPGPETIAELEPFENVQALEELADPSLGGIRAPWIKWNLPRMVAAAHVKAVVVTGLKVAMSIADADKQFWITPGKKLYLRATLHTPRPAPKTPRLWLYELQITSVSPAAVIAQSFVDVPETEFLRGGVLYDPMMMPSGHVKLIDPAVEMHISVNGEFPKPAVRIAGSKPGPCFDKHPDAPFESVDAPPIPGGPALTRDRFNIIGLHNGGYFVACGVGRPTGRCKLRRAFDFATHVVWPFCHVCKYVIVDLVDPNQHIRLDWWYP